MSPTATLPLDDASAADRACEVVTARALRRSLLPGLDIGDVAHELASLAGYRRGPLNKAIARIDRARMERTSAVVERAQLSLLAALDLVAAPASRVAAA